MSKYLDPYTDFGFKKLFGEEANKDLLTDFLNSFLPEKHQIETLAFRNTEQLGPIPLDRKAFFDIYCEAKNGEKFIVEMQKAKQNWFKDRAVFYVTFPIRDQAEKGLEWQFELKAIYYVGVLDFIYDENEARKIFLRDETDPSRDATDPGRDVTDHSCDATDPSRDVTDKSRDATDKSRDVTDKSRDATDKSRDVTDKSRDVTDKSRDVTDRKP